MTYFNRVSGIVRGLGLLVLWAGPGCTNIGQDGCLSDTECKGSRVCMRSVCIEPANASMVSGLGSEPIASEGDAPQTLVTDDEDVDVDAGGIAGSGGGPPVETVDAGPEVDDGWRPADVEYVCIVAGDGACQNTADCPLIEDGSAKATAKECGVECATSPNPDCAGACIQDRTGLSAMCSSCFQGFFDCLLAECLAPCLSGTAEECGDCSREKPAGNSCADQLVDCSGTDLNPDYVAP